MTIFTKLFSSQGRDIIEEGTSNGFQYAIVDGPYCYCAYVALPEGHKYYDVFYDDIPIECNGGLTFSGKYDNFYLIGWDYGHCDDYYPFNIIFDDLRFMSGKKWTTEEILEEVHNVIAQL